MKFTQIDNSAISKLDFDNIEFGKVFTDYMLTSDFNGETWSEMSLEPLADLKIHPGTSVLHYGQAIFEGLKAYKTDEGKVNIFRLKDNLSRLNKSAERMKMATIDEEVALEATKTFVEKQKDWIPPRDKGSLYIRPFMISTDNTLRALASESYKFMVIACPVGFYYSTPLNIYLEKRFSRAATGGVGYAKAAGNYAASFYPAELAKGNGFDQILWTNINDEYTLEELGSANFFFVRRGELYTPTMQDSILDGITRKSVIQLAKQSGMKVIEQAIKAADFEKYISAGEVECMFATGTAAAITYVNGVNIDGSQYSVKSDEYSSVQNIEKLLDKSKYLEDDTNPSWNVVI